MFGISKKENKVVKIVATTNKKMPQSNSYYKLRLRAEVSNLSNKTLERAVYLVYSKEIYGSITQLEYTEV